MRWLLSSEYGWGTGFSATSPILQNDIQLRCRLPVCDSCLEMSSGTALQPLLLAEPSNTQGRQMATQIFSQQKNLHFCLQWRPIFLIWCTKKINIKIYILPAVATHRRAMRRSLAGWRRKWPRGGRAKGKDNWCLFEVKFICCFDLVTSGSLLF